MAAGVRGRSQAYRMIFFSKQFSLLISHQLWQTEGRSFQTMMQPSRSEAGERRTHRLPRRRAAFLEP